MEDEGRDGGLLSAASRYARSALASRVPSGVFAEIKVEVRRSDGTRKER